MNDKFGKNSFFSLPSCDKFPQFNHSLKFINSINAFPSQSCINIENPPEQTPLPPEEDSLAEHLTLLHATSNSTKKKKMGCTCKKTLCLKMYCECFSSGKKCGGDCGCSGCKNLPEFEEDIAVAKTTIKDGGLRNCSLSEKRCNCKKSQCQKRYCECFNSGVGCTEACKCEGCLNNGIDFNHQMKSFDDKIEIEQLLEKKEKKHDFPALVYHSVEDLSRFYS